MFEKMRHFFLFIFVFAKGTLLVHSVQINSIHVPSAVRNNSEVPVILDCNYSLRPDDSDLVVKWYLNDDLVYQWIPPQKPQSFGLLKDRLDLQYNSTDDPRTMYKSMKIFNPTNDIAGEYKCFVSSFTDEDFSLKNMIVFEPEEYMGIVKGQEIEDAINFTCIASGVYPEPRLILYKDLKNDFYNKVRLSTVQRDFKKEPNGRYTVFMVSSVPLSMLIPGTLIHCELRIPGTSYVKIKSLLYYPENLEEKSGGSFRIKNIGPFFFLLFLLINVNHNYYTS